LTHDEFQNALDSSEVGTSLIGVTGDPIWWQEPTRYRELATWLREIVRKCKLPNAEQELLDLAQRYQRRADQIPEYRLRDRSDVEVRSHS
jgi:hypothetical protein